MTKTLPQRIIARAKRSWHQRAFDRTAARILDTAPLRMTGDSPLFVSQLRHSDVNAYLLAVKSLYRHFGQGRVVVISDGSLTAEDLHILGRHIPNIETLDVRAIATGPCPRGGTWERLIKIVELSADNYVIQVDADILAVDSTPELLRFWRENKSFLLGTDSGRSISTAVQTAQMVQGWIRKYGWDPIPVGVEAEAALDQLPDAEKRAYVHGSSGFAGFARGAFALGDLEWFSTTMSALLGAERWKQLGTEQIASNYILANAPNAAVLPFPRYACHEPHVGSDPSVLLHFIGTYRFSSGAYRRHASNFIRSFAP
jgi:hypothetical protein